MFDGQDCGVGFGISHAIATCVNSSGAIAGDFGCPGSPGQAFIRFTGNTLLPLPVPPGTFQTVAVDISSHGAILGQYGSTAPGASGGFMYFNGQWTDLGLLPGGNGTEPHAINDDHVVVGAWGHNVSGPFPLAFRWQNGVMQDLSADLPMGPLSQASGISPNGLITGWMGTSLDVVAHPFVWEKGLVTDLGLPFPDAFSAHGVSINSRGQVAGEYRYRISTSPFFERGTFFFDGKTMHRILTDTGYSGLSVQDMNEGGDIIANSGSQPMLWRNGVTYRVRDLVVPPLAGMSFIGVSAIADNGSISGAANITAQSRLVAVLLTPIPPMVGDTNCDQHVNVSDLLTVLTHWGDCASSQSCVGDVNHDLHIDVWDLLVVVTHWSS